MQKLILSLALAFILLSGCSYRPPDKDLQQQINFKEIPRFENYGQLQAAFANYEQRNYGLMRTAMEVASLPANIATATTMQSAAKSDGDFSTTNVQIEGVDEADIVKTDGKYIYAIAKNNLYIVDANGQKIISKLDMAAKELTPLEMFITEKKLLIFASNSGYDYKGGTLSKRSYPYYNSSNTTVLLYDISDKSGPVQEKEIQFFGSYLASRLVDGKAVFVINSYPNRQYNNEMPGDDDIIPLMSEDGVETKIAMSTEIGYLYPMPARSFVTIATLDLNNKTLEKETIAASAESVFASSQNIYLASTVWLPQEPIVKDNNFEIKVRDFIYGDEEQTVVNKFNFGSGKIRFAGQGIVPGHVLNQFSMDEFEGNFRIATTRGQVSREFASTNNIYVLDIDMNKIGALEGLAPGEKIYSARFMGKRAYVVTFKKVDPLFVIDLENPKDPKVLGKLKIPGYSDYLHPIDETHLIGVGKDTIESGYGDFAWYQGMKMAIFDVSDVSNPKEMYKLIIGDRGTDSYALRDHKAFLYDRAKNLLVLPIELHEIKNKEQYEDMAVQTGGPTVQPRSFPSYGEQTFQGAFVYKVTLENGFEERGRITHITPEEELKSGYYYDQESFVKRSLYIGNILYTLSEKMLKANDLGTLEELGSVEFN